MSLSAFVCWQCVKSPGHFIDHRLRFRLGGRQIGEHQENMVCLDHAPSMAEIQNADVTESPDVSKKAPRKQGHVLRTIWVYINAVLWCILTGIPGMLCILLTPFIGLSGAQRMTWRCSVLFFRIVLWSAGCPYSVSGLENLDPNRSYFFASNHESNFDVPLLFATLPFWLISVAKKSLAYVPIFGWAVACGGTIFIDRNNTKRAIESMKNAEEALRKRPRSVLVFPEGTRTPDGNIQKFKKGCLILAIQTGMAIVPVAVSGTYNVVEKGGRSITPCPLHVTVGKPIETSGMTIEDRDALCDRLQAEVTALKSQYAASQKEH